ncbi:MAG: hypothetical protein M3M85_00620 [bacterium]|nr:hypothetical protein [bacterium]
MTKTKKISKGKIIAAAAAGAAVLGAGAYYLLGPNKTAHQKKAKALYEKMKREVKKEAKRAKELSLPVYNKAVDVISENYAKQYKLHEKEIKAIAQKLKGEWKDISGKAEKEGNRAKRAIKGTKRSNTQKATKIKK